MYKLTASGSRAEVEAAGDTLFALDPSPCLAVDMREEGRTGWRLDAFAETLEDAEACAAIARDAAPMLAPRIEAVETRDWVALSLEGLPPVRAGRFVVAGEHAAPAAGPGKTLVRIEAGPAFGTGHHGTTLGCLLGLQRLARRQPLGRTLDLGAGSGVLAIAALKAGAARAVGTDIDAESVRTARENAAKNQSGRRLRLIEANGAHDVLVRSGAPYRTIFANILLKPLVRLAPDIARLAAPGGGVVISGLLLHQEPLARAAFIARGLKLTDRIRRDGWLTLVFVKPPQPWAARRAQRASRRAKRRGPISAAPGRATRV